MNDKHSLMHYSCTQ